MYFFSGKSIEFKLERFSAANLYLLQDTYVSVVLSLTNKDGTTLAKTKSPSLVNNVLHSLFQSVELFINDVPISNCPDDYQYKSYISSVLTYPTACKTTHLESQGFYPDTAQHFGNVDTNYGSKGRNQMFRVDGDLVNEYKKGPITLIGRVYHELMNIETGLPPGIKIRQFVVQLKIKF